MRSRYRNRICTVHLWYLSSQADNMTRTGCRTRSHGQSRDDERAALHCCCMQQAESCSWNPHPVLWMERHNNLGHTKCTWARKYFKFVFVHTAVRIGVLILHRTVRRFLHIWSVYFAINFISILGSCEVCPGKKIVRVEWLNTADLTTTPRVG